MLLKETREIHNAVKGKRPGDEYALHASECTMTCVKLPRYIVLNKRVGETPLQAVGLWKEAHPEHKDATACYAGRLDPMAEGKLLVLFGEECKQIKNYTGLDKEYEIEVLVDIGTDTGDVLGLPTYAGVETTLDTKQLAKVLQGEVGSHERPYPAFSSKTVNGKPLFLHALEGTLPELPTHIERIYRIQQVSVETFTRDALQERIRVHLSYAPRTKEPSKVLGKDFRQDAVREQWEEVLKSTDRTFLVVRLRVICASGTYMRTLAGSIGGALGTRALALSIKRTKIGKYWNGLWLKAY